MTKAKMTLTNESVTFYSRGIWIQPILSDGFWFNGNISEFFSIVIYHHELDYTHTRFFVREG